MLAPQCPAPQCPAPPDSAATTGLTCHEPPVVPPRPHGDVSCRGAAGKRHNEALCWWQRRTPVDLISPEVDLLLCRPDHKRDVAILSFLLPDVERWGFQHVSIHQRDGPDKASSEGEVCQVARGPGRVLLPGDGLSQKAGFTAAVTALPSLTQC